MYRDGCWQERGLTANGILTCNPWVGTGNDLTALIWAMLRKAIDHLTPSHVQPLWILGIYQATLWELGVGGSPGETQPIFSWAFKHCCYRGFSLSHPAWRWPKGLNIVGYFRINDNIINNIFSSFVSVLGIESRMLLLPGKGYCKWATCPDLALSQRLTNHFTGPGIKVSFHKYQCSSCTDRAGEQQVQGRCWTASHAAAQRLCCKARYTATSALKALI